MGSAEGNIFIIELWHLSFVIADYQEDLVSKFKVVRVYIAKQVKLHTVPRISSLEQFPCSTTI